MRKHLPQDTKILSQSVSGIQVQVRKSVWIDLKREAARTAQLRFALGLAAATAIAAHSFAAGAILAVTIASSAAPSRLLRSPPAARVLHPEVCTGEL
jgi:hypothetical protein